MKIYFSSLVISLTCLFGFACPKNQTYVGSTPADVIVRNFLGISLTDSIDFIRWKVEINPTSFELKCKYGIGKPNTAGFIDEKIVGFSGTLKKENNRYVLVHQDRKISFLEVNSDLLHLADLQNKMLVGTDGFSYVLNSTNPVGTSDFNINSISNNAIYPQVYVGRTPCRELAGLLGLPKNEPCYKMKWRIILHTDSMTNKPSYYLYGGNRFTGEPMKKGSWQLIQGNKGQVIYRVYPEDPKRAVYLVKGDDNILFFSDPSGRLLVGNEDFSYTLNRKTDD